MTDTVAATLVTEPTSEPTKPPPSDDIVYDPEDDLLPPPKPADQSTAGTNVTTLVVVRG